MEFNLLRVRDMDADALERDVNYPAIQEGPLYRIMFPAPVSPEQRDEIVEWYIEGLRETLSKEADRFRQIRNAQGVAVGLLGWTLASPRLEGKREPDSSARQTDRRREVPNTLDLAAWCHVSAALRRERERVLRDLGDVCRLTLVSVHPKYQRRGLGSQLLKWFCEEVDQLDRHAYVLAAPAGVPLYRKFGFKTVGIVETSEGIITSMLRHPPPGPELPKAHQGTDESLPRRSD